MGSPDPAAARQEADAPSKAPARASGAFLPNNSDGFNHEKHEAHEMMSFGWRGLYLIATPEDELKKGLIFLRENSFRVFSVFRGDL
jgi:hypothetical protein